MPSERAGVPTAERALLNSHPNRVGKGNVARNNDTNGGGRNTFYNQIFGPRTAILLGRSICM